MTDTLTKRLDALEEKAKRYIVCPSESVLALIDCARALENVAYQERLHINEDERRAFHICGDLARDALARLAKALEGR